MVRVAGVVYNMAMGTQPKKKDSHIPFGPPMRSTSYSARHKRVVRNRGRAADQQCSRCSDPATDWAQRRGTDGENPEDYDPLCRSCHIAYDELISKRRPVAWTDEMRQEWSERSSRLWNDPEYRAKRPVAKPRNHGPHNRDKEECPEGHRYTEQNTYIGRRGDGTTF